jgi:hypothetical protein
MSDESVSYASRETARLRARALAGVLAFVGAGAGAGAGACRGGVHSLPVDGTPGQPVPATVFSSVVLVNGAVDGVAGGPFLVDTGAPVTLVNPDAFAAAALPTGDTYLGTLAVGALTIHDVPAIGSTTLVPFGFGGILGGNVICQFQTSFDYRVPAVVLGEAAPPSDVEVAGVTASFRLEGGGNGVVPAATRPVAFPATRIVLHALLEGTDRVMMVDTGASTIVLRDSVFTQLVSDGRGVLSDLPITMVGTMSLARVTRVRSLSVAGAVVTGAPAATIGDTVLDNVGQEVGHPLDGLIGGSYLREFYVTIDYPRGELHLRRYANLDHIVDEFQRVGIVLNTAPAGAMHRYAIFRVYPGTDAERQGLMVGEAIVAIDGVALDNVPPSDVDALLLGPAGASRQITLSTREVTVRIDDLLPLP